MGGGLREWTYPRGSLPWNSERLLQGDFGDGASLSMGAPLGNLEGGLLLLGSLKVVREGSGDGFSTSWGLSWATWSGLIDRGL